ncbi:MAG: hypothetical protein SPI26_05515, partial [Oscillospiraceae bacterium]|nr:hypothetical protein [Oscillospiraceae bacterium]
MRKRILSWALVLCMVLTLLPGTALAVDEPVVVQHPCKHAGVETVKAAAPTCENPGYTGDQVCTICKETIETGKDIPALGHQHAEGAQPINVKPATCTENGEASYVCSVCGKLYSETTQAQHTVEKWDLTKAPTC